MTDNEIIKALECCLSSNNLTACWKCPIVKLDICCNGSSKISNGIVKEIINLINRQKAEIEKLKRENIDKERAYNEEFCLRKEWQNKYKELSEIIDLIEEMRGEQK